MIALCLYQLFMVDSSYVKKEELESEEHATHKNVTFLITSANLCYTG